MAKKKSTKSRAATRPKRGARRGKGLPEGSPATEPFGVCGVGASAGGLEAFTQLLRALPVDTGLAFVLVQHLDPKRESLLSELLARATAMPVLEVEDKTPVKSNHIYVIPRNRDMMIADVALRQLPRPETPGPHLPVDFFFRSMAENLGPRAIGVIL